MMMMMINLSYDPDLILDNQKLRISHFNLE